MEDQKARPPCPSHPQVVLVESMTTQDIGKLGTQLSLYVFARSSEQDLPKVRWSGKIGQVAKLELLL